MYFLFSFSLNLFICAFKRQIDNLPQVYPASRPMTAECMAGCRWMDVLLGFKTRPQSEK